MPKKNKISFADLGLQTSIPVALTKTANEKHLERLKSKKEKGENAKNAFTSLNEGKAIVLKHRQYVAEEQARAKEEKDARKQTLKAEHIKAQNERQKASKQRESELVRDQEKVAAKVKHTIAEQDEQFAKLKVLIQERDEQEIKAAVPSINITVARVPEIQETRMSLPVMREEQAIVEAVNEAPGACVLICGETGSGKTTQVPQLLWECGYSHADGKSMGREGMIIVTEPRRVAAVAMARRVADELNESFGGKVGYQVRYDNNLCDETQMKFATEGILLREIQSDFLLKKYSVVIVDEAHERSVSGDILIGMLSRIVPLRASLSSEGAVLNNVKVTPLKLVIMSATMRVSDFRDNRLLLPREPPLINVEARRFPVTNHFAKKTEMRNYCEEAFRKVTQIHKKLPPGGILMFLCTQREIDSMCERLRRHYRKTKIIYDESNYKKHALTAARHKPESERDAYGLANEQYELEGDSGHKMVSNTLADFGLRDDFDYHDEGRQDIDSSPVGVTNDTEDDGSLQEPGSDAEDNDDENEFSPLDAPDENEEGGAFDSLHVLPLYSLLNFQDQQRVFTDPPPGKRLCVVATNVAETSITIPGIRYVIDCGRVKNKNVDATSGASAFSIEWTSRASAEQRAGRAGRTAPGHTYRLYSTAVFTNLMPEHSIPEILRTPIESVVLLMKSLSIEHISRFPFPTPPRADDIEQATKHLIILGALNRKDLRITALGSKLTLFPVAPRYAKMISTAMKIGQPLLIEIVVAMVAVAATTLDVFEHGSVQEASRKNESADMRFRVADQKRLLHAGSDLITFLKSMGMFAARPTLTTAGRFNLIHKSLTEANQLRKQLLGAVRNSESLEEALFVDGTDGPEDNACSCFDAQGSCMLKQSMEILARKVIAIGLIDQVARRATVHECRSRDVEFTSGKSSKVPYLDVKSGTIVFIHPSSTVASTHPAPEFVVYCGLQRSKRSHLAESNVQHTFMKGVTIVTKEWLDAVDFDEEVVSDIYRRPLENY